MKQKTFVILSLILILMLGQISAMAINPRPNDRPDGTKYRAMDQYYENAGGEKGLVTYEYDESGNLRLSIWERLDQVRNSLNFYEYDENNNLIRQYREFSDRTFSEEKYEYGADGKLVRELFSHSNGVSGKMDYEYDEQGIIKRVVCDKCKLWFTGEIIFQNDVNGRPVRGNIISDGDSSGTIEYSYDTNGNLIREHWNFPGVWSQTFTYNYGVFKPVAPSQYTSANVFIRNNRDYRVSGENYEYSDGSGGPSRYEYDKIGKLVRKRYDYSSGFSTKTFFLYDFNGRLTRSYRLSSSGLSGVFSYKYNDMGLLSERKYVQSDGKSADENYEYDDNGNLKSGKLMNFDSWLSGTLTFSYTGDRLEKGFFKGDNNFDADITFDFDANDNLIGYKWVFTSGDAQTYSFKYEKIE